MRKKIKLVRNKTRNKILNNIIKILLLKYKLKTKSKVNKIQINKILIFSKIIMVLQINLNKENSKWSL